MTYMANIWTSLRQEQPVQCLPCGKTLNTIATMQKQQQI